MPIEPFLDWSSYRDAGLGDAYADVPKTGGDLAKAISVCIDSLRCQSQGKGVMCPSYRVTGEASLSTGGRVRLLKTALNSELPGVGLEAPELARAMDLCVACKGCRRECENGVDMAMIKSEYLAQRHARQRPALRTRWLSNLSALLHRFPSGRRLIAARNRFPPLAHLGEKLFGISRRRRLPVPVPRTALRQHAREPALAAAPADTLVLLVDTFTNNFAPETAAAARRVLEHAGFRVVLAQASAGERPLCCGRTHLANGMVREAEREARRLLGALLPHLRAGHRIIGLEPACLLAIREDYGFLGLGEAAAQIAKQALLFEEFLAREITRKGLKLPLAAVDTGGQPLLVHGHCHQKAAGAMKSVRKVLKAIPGLEFELVEASCCGMAGGFGIEREHAEISLRMAEADLFPTLRAHPGARILANGFSCRHQIEDGLNRQTVHLACLLEESFEAAQFNPHRLETTP